MKLTAPLLTLSLAANALLALLWLRSPASNEAGNVSARIPVPSTPLGPAESAAAALRADPQLAEAIGSGDPRRLLPALRQAGFPDAYTRDIILWLANDTKSPEHLELLRQTADLPYWAPNSDPRRAALQTATRQLDAAGKQLAREAYGETPPPHPLQDDYQQLRYRFLPADKLEAVARIDNDYNELLMEAHREGQAAGLADNLRLMEQEKRADLAAVLSPAELELYDLNLSNTAASMRNMLAHFAPTEAEFRSLYPLRRDFDEKFGFPNNTNAPGAHQAAQKAMNDQIRALLGDARYAEYERAQDISYLAAREITRHYNLPTANADAVYALQRSTQQRLNELRLAAGSDAEALRASTQALAGEVNVRVTELLGAKGADAYRKSGGYWLQNLDQRRGSNTATVTFSPGG